MADIPQVKTRSLTREILATFLKNHELIKAFENLMQDVSVTLPEAAFDDRVAIEAAQASADAAQLTADGAVLDAAAAQADVDAHEASTGTAVHGLGTSSVLNSDSDGALTADSDLLLPTQRAVKTYADGLVAAAGAVIGPASSADNNVAMFNGVTGKIIKDSGLTLSGNNTGDQTITLTGDATGSGTGSFSVTLASTGVPAGTYGSATRATIFTVDAKGRLTAASDALITPAWSSITGTPTTATGYGIASIDAVPIGSTTQSTGAFTTLSTTGNVKFTSATTILDGVSGSQRPLQVASTGNAGANFGRWSADANAPVVGFVKSRGATIGTYTIVSSGDQLGRVSFAGGDGANPIAAAYIAGEVDAAPGLASMPGRLVFYTTPTGSSTPAERMRIDSSGNALIQTVGTGLRVKEGANAKQGTAVLVAGTVTVANTSITASSRIQLTSNADGGTPGWLRVSARVAGTSFTITSSSATDTSTIAYFITEPA